MQMSTLSFEQGIYPEFLFDMKPLCVSLLHQSGFGLYLMNWFGAQADELPDLLWSGLTGLADANLATHQGKALSAKQGTFVLLDLRFFFLHLYGRICTLVLE